MSSRKPLVSVAAGGDPVGVYRRIEDMSEYSRRRAAHEKLGRLNFEIDLAAQEIRPVWGMVGDAHGVGYHGAGYA
jgi:hypothetical protein